MPDPVGFAVARIDAGTSRERDANGMFQKTNRHHPRPSDDERVVLTDRERELLRAEMDALIYRFGSPGVM